MSFNLNLLYPKDIFVNFCNNENMVIIFNLHVSVHRKNILIYVQQDAMLHSLFIWKLLYMFRVVPPPIIRNAHNCIYSVWYLSDRYCYLLL